MVLAVFVLYSCAHGPGLKELSDTTVPHVELENTPFFPQQKYYCGPAALATVLTATGVEVTGLQPLADQVYVPAKQGTLQAELLAATRRAQRLPFVIEPALPALVQELSRGQPVLVLQDLAPFGKPVWHYAVVIGYDADHDLIILRSGKEYRQIMSTAKFMRSWQRAGHWGFVVLPAGQLPASLDSNRYLQAVKDFQHVAESSLVADAYRAATVRWPNVERAWVGLSEALYRSRQPERAVTALKAGIKYHPASIALHNNLALTLNDLGCNQQARSVIAEAGHLARKQHRFLKQVADTKLQIFASQRTGDRHCR